MRCISGLDYYCYGDSESFIPNIQMTPMATYARRKTGREMPIIGSHRINHTGD